MHAANIDTLATSLWNDRMVLISLKYVDVMLNWSENELPDLLCFEDLTSDHKMRVSSASYLLRAVHARSEQNSG